MRARTVKERTLASDAGIDPLRAQHIELGRRQIRDETGFSDVTVDEAESPLAWLARRKGRDGRALIEPVQLLAGERLRAEFTRAHLMPRITSNWSASVATGPRGASPATFTETVIGARQRVRAALEAVGPEFSGLSSTSAAFSSGWKKSNASEAGRCARPRSCCNSVSIGWLATMACSARRRARGAPRSERGWRRASNSYSRRRRVVISSPPPSRCWRRGGCDRPSSGSRWSAEASGDREVRASRTRQRRRWTGCPSRPCRSTARTGSRSARARYGHRCRRRMPAPARCCRSA